MPPLNNIDSIKTYLSNAFDSVFGPPHLTRDRSYYTKISEAELELVQKYYPLYKAAADKANVPWQMLAAIHYRENSLQTSTKMAGGVLQFDGAGSPVSTTFEEDLVKAGKFLQEKVRNSLTSTTTDEHQIKNAFYGYNGRAYGSYNKSPYVMSRFNEHYCNMEFIGSNPDSNDRDGDGNRTERNPVHGIDKRLGAYTFYSELRKVFPHD